jgi:type VI secretion system protein ImpB
MAESTQHKLDRVRKPRVHLTYDVEVGDATQQKELPFLMGVMSDLSGNPEEPLPKLKDRKFVEIDRDNFNKVMGATKPRLAYRVDNKLTEEDTKIGVELKFNSLDDFSPENVVQQIDPLRKLLDARKRLSDLLQKLDGNDKLDELLQDVLGNTEKLSELKEATGGETEEAGE